MAETLRFRPENGSVTEHLELLQQRINNKKAELEVAFKKGNEEQVERIREQIAEMEGEYTQFEEENLAAA